MKLLLPMINLEVNLILLALILLFWGLAKINEYILYVIYILLFIYFYFYLHYINNYLKTYNKCNKITNTLKKFSA